MLRARKAKTSSNLKWSEYESWCPRLAHDQIKYTWHWWEWSHCYMIQYVVCVVQIQVDIYDVACRVYIHDIYGPTSSWICTFHEASLSEKSPLHDPPDRRLLHTLPRARRALASSSLRLCWRPPAHWAHSTQTATHTYIQLHVLSTRLLALVFGG